MSLGNNMIMASGAVIEPENVSIPVLTPRNETFTITVVNSGGNKFYANGQNSLYVELYQGFTYTFDQSDASNSGHPLRFSTCLLYTSPSPRDGLLSRMPSSA